MMCIVRTKVRTPVSNTTENHYGVMMCIVRTKVRTPVSNITENHYNFAVAASLVIVIELVEIPYHITSFHMINCML